MPDLHRSKIKNSLMNKKLKSPKRGVYSEKGDTRMYHNLKNIIQYNGLFDVYAIGEYDQDELFEKRFSDELQEVMFNLNDFSYYTLEEYDSLLEEEAKRTYEENKEEYVDFENEAAAIEFIKSNASGSEEDFIHMYCDEDDCLYEIDYNHY